MPSTKEFRPQPGNDTHVIVGREHALKELRREGMRAWGGTKIFRLLLHGWHVRRSIVRVCLRLHTFIVLRARVRRVPKFGGPCKQLFPSGRCRRRPHAGELNRARKGPVLFGELHYPLIPAKDRISIAQFGSRPLALMTALAAGLRRKSITARPPSGAGEALGANAVNCVTLCSAAGNGPTTSTLATAISSAIC